MAPRRTLVFLAIGIGLLASLLRFTRLGADGLWVDEAYTVGLVTRSSSEITEQLRQDDAPPLFYLLEKAALSLFGRGEAAARLLPALLGTALAVGVALWLARRDLSLGVCAGILVAVDPMLVFYSRQGRSYALLHLLSIALVWLALRLHAKPTRLAALGFAAVASAILSTHNLGLWTVLAGGLAILPLVRSPGARAPVVIALGLTSVAVAGWLVPLLGQLGVHRELNPWMGLFWESRPLALGPLLSLAAFTPGAGSLTASQIGLPGLDRSWQGIGPVLWTAAAIGIAGAFLRPKDLDAQRLAYTLSLFVAIPLLGLVATSVMIGPAYVVGRTDTLALAPFIVLLALGSAAWTRTTTGAARVVALLALALALVLPGLSASLSLLSPQGRLAKGSDRELAAWLGTQVRAKDAVVYGPLVRPTLAYYGERGEWLDRIEWFGGFPSQIDLNPAAIYPTPFDSLDAWREEALRLREAWDRSGVRDVYVLSVRTTSGAPGASPGAWPVRPAAPPTPRATLTANEVIYPTSVLLYVLAGLSPLPVLREYRQDWVAGERVVIRVRREDWVDPASLRDIEVQP